ncbi:hypothetical protein GKA01_22360 [Gluconobacter kanchanaburiensis NBRC 103587]|uniref:Transposase n=1 Tax=Gluconobacter kanchanaburiensis NBRC 103587 TaxID=1307948 RepID=A0A511B9E0_9PROT|nr:hypothetical protein AA103587_1230 [Gluconobacter kanchanaburiensis NBRC 103587]GEK97039.1 hypothetical protein GKA01_22360 [Gluconobacter kanchanaburiensis NBRC 103587]
MERARHEATEWTIIDLLLPPERGRWAEQSVWDALLQALVDLSLTDNWQHMADSTVIRAHSQATGAKEGGSFGGFWSVTRRLYEQNPCPM